MLFCCEQLREVLNDGRLGEKKNVNVPGVGHLKGLGERFWLMNGIIQPVGLVGFLLTLINHPTLFSVLLLQILGWFGLVFCLGDF